MAVPDSIHITDRPVAAERLARLVAAWFGDMVKLVIDTRLQRVAVGGELHADAEQLLLEGGSQQADLWGANYYPGRGHDECLEYTALINIRPSQDNPSMEILDPDIRATVRGIVFRLVGEGGEV